MLIIVSEDLGAAGAADVRGRVANVVGTRIDALCVLKVVTGGVAPPGLVDEAPEPGRVGRVGKVGRVGRGYSSSSQSSSPPCVGVPVGLAGVFKVVGTERLLEETWSLKAPPGTEKEVDTKGTVLLELLWSTVELRVMKIGGAKVLLAEAESVGSQSSSSPPVGTAGVGVEADVEDAWVMNMPPEVELLVKDVSDDEAVDEVAEVVEEPPMDVDDVKN